MGPHNVFQRNRQKDLQFVWKWVQSKNLKQLSRLHSFIHQWLSEKHQCFRVENNVTGWITQDFMCISLKSKVIGSKVSDVDQRMGTVGGGCGGGGAGKAIVDLMLFWETNRGWMLHHVKHVAARLPRKEADVWDKKTWRDPWAGFHNRTRRVMKLDQEGQRQVCVTGCPCDHRRVCDHGF